MQFLSLPRNIAAALAACLILFAAGRTAGQEFAPLIEQKDALIIAALQGTHEDVLKLLEKGTSVNASTPFGETALSYALQRRMFDLARDLMARGFNPTLVYKSAGTGEILEIGTMALTEAAKKGAEDIVDGLLARGLQPFPKQSADIEGIEIPSAMTAITAGHLEMAKKILAKVEPDVLRRHLARNSFAYLSACRSVALIDVLVKSGAALDKLSSDAPRVTLLHVYAKQGWREGIEHLLGLGLDPTIESRAGELPEKYATDPGIVTLLRLAEVRTRVERAHGRSGNGKFLLLILQAAIQESEAAAMERLQAISTEELDVADDRGWTLLNYALRYKQTKLARVLIERGASVKHVTSFGSGMASFAASTGDTELVRLVVGKGAAIDAAENGRATALLLSVQSGDVAMVDTLLALGANPEPPRPGERATPWSNALMTAAKAGNIALMDRLLKARADLHAVDSSGESAVFYAARSGKVAALGWLVDRGAYVHLKTPRGTNALTLAASLNHLEIVKALLAMGVTHPDALEFAERHAANETADYLRELKLRVNPNDPAELWKRYYDLTIEDVRRYLASGGDVNFAQGCPTPLQAMCSRGDPEAVILLLDRGADPHKRGALSNSSVFLGMSGGKTEEQGLQMLRAFLDHGIAVDTREYSFGMIPPETVPTGPTLLTVAIQIGRMQCARYLLKKGANPTIRDYYMGRNAFDELQGSRYVDEPTRAEFKQLLDAAAKKFPAEPVPAAEQTTRPRLKV